MWYLWLALALALLLVYVFRRRRPGPVLGPPSAGDVEPPTPIIIGNDPLLTRRAAFEESLKRLQELSEGVAERIRVDLDKIRRQGIFRSGMRANVAAFLGGDYQEQMNRTADLSNEDISRLWFHTPEVQAFVARQEEEEQASRLQIGWSGIIDAN